MPVYNSEEYLEEAIQSIINQTYKNWELLISDDGSTDSSKNIIEKYTSLDNRITGYYNEKNIGKNAVVNNLLQFTNGSFISIHDSDDLSHPKRFESQMKELINNHNLALISCMYCDVTPKFKISDIHTLVSEKKKSCFHGPTTLFKKNIIDEVGGLYRKYFIVAEDIDFITRVSEKFPTMCLSQVLYFYRWHPSSLTKTVDGYKPERYALYDLLEYLKKQRAFLGTDDLMNGNSKSLEEQYKLFVYSWSKKKEFIYLDGIYRSWYFKIPKNALNLSCKLLLANPWNFKYIFLCLKSIYLIINISLSSNEKNRKIYN